MGYAERQSAAFIMSEHSTSSPISTETLAALHQHLPSLNFDPDTDATSEQLSVAQEYLRYYNLRPEDVLPQVQHYLGTTNVSMASGEHFTVVCHYWLHPEAKDTTFVVHGYFDHVGLYGHLIKDLLERGSNVVTFDLPGHGISSGERATIASFDHYVEVLDAICQLAKINLPKLHFPKPWRAIGQSTGGSIVLKHILEAGSRGQPPVFDQAILLAPLVRPRFWRFNGWVYLLTRRFLQRIDRVFVPNSGDRDFVEFIKAKDPLQARHLSLEWIGAMKRWIARFIELPESDFPITIIQGDRDATVDWKGNLDLLRDKFPNSRVHMLSGAQHHLVNETQKIREKIFALIARY